jgi:hypothetical protein
LNPRKEAGTAETFSSQKHKEKSLLSFSLVDLLLPPIGAQQYVFLLFYPFFIPFVPLKKISFYYNLHVCIDEKLNTFVHFTFSHSFRFIGPGMDKDWSINIRITPDEGSGVKEFQVKFRKKHLTISLTRPPLPRKGENKPDIEQVCI